MLIRPTIEQTFECISQEQHALISGMLAGAWAESTLDPMWVQLIGLHDTAWRPADAEPRINPQTGLPYDFITYPMAKKVALYRQGIDILEDINPWLATMVSRHYTTFSGTKNIQTLQDPENARRDRLAERINPERLAEGDRALEWIKFFDIFSLYICLTGPNAEPDRIPRWLKNPDTWSTAPDGVELRLRWQDDGHLSVKGWPFADKALRVDLYPRLLVTTYQTQANLDAAWREAPVQTRAIVLR